MQVASTLAPKRKKERKKEQSYPLCFTHTHTCNYLNTLFKVVFILMAIRIISHALQRKIKIPKSIKKKTSGNVTDNLSTFSS
jgi:hypothetical protein